MDKKIVSREDRRKFRSLNFRVLKEIEVYAHTRRLVYRSPQAQKELSWIRVEDAVFHVASKLEEHGWSKEDRRRVKLLRSMIDEFFVGDR